MVIQALCEYYDILAQKGEVLQDGYSRVGVDYLIELNLIGELVAITDYKETWIDEKGKVKYKSREVILPRRLKTKKSYSSIIEHRALSIFGICFNEKNIKKASESHSIFTGLNLRFIENIDSEIVNAYRCFIENWEPEKEKDNKILNQIKKAFDNSKFVFCLEGRPDLLLHEDEKLLQKWENERYDFGDISNCKSQCCIYGEVLSIARIHSEIVGVNGSNSTGAGLVAFKEKAYESYGKKQSYNSNISETAMKKYTEALNYLLSKREHKSSLDDITVVHFAMSKNTKNNDVMKSLIFEGFSLAPTSEKMGEKSTESWVKSILQHSNSGSLNTENFAGLEEIDPNVEFYMIGIKPNAARLSVKFAYKQKIGKLLLNIAQHQNDLQISDEFKPMSLWQLKQELISPNSSKETLNPALSAKLFDSILYGYNYPDFLLQTVIRRVKVDSDTETNSFIKINPRRIGIIKACINRKARNLNKQEEITMALNEQNKNQAYLCGRLFAVLEMVQKKSAQKSAVDNLNRTIKDAYFSSATSRPQMVFPKLVTLSSYHLSKMKKDSKKKGLAIYFDKTMGEIMNELNGEFPKTLSLEDQGRFVVGYYQQLHKKNNNETTEEEN